MAVRLERVIVDLDDRFTRPAANMAAATTLLRKRADEAGHSVDAFGRSTDKAGPSIDRLSGRVRILADVAAIIGPAVAPIGATAIPALTGLAAQFGFAAVAGGTAITAFQGVGDALKAMNEARLEPTVENLAKARAEMDKISPAAREFVMQIQTMIPQLTRLRDAAAEGMFPGLTEALDTLTGRLPDVQRILAAVGGALGDIASSSAESLAGSRWDEFFTFLETDAPEALAEMAQATGNVAHAMAEFWMAFDPLNDDFSDWLVDATHSMDEFASGLSDSEGFLAFMDYVRTTGPKVADALGAIGNMFVQIVEAASPLGGPVLAGLEATADAIAAIADSDLGTPIFTALAAVALYNRALGITTTLSRGAFMSGPMAQGIKNQGIAVRSLAADWRAYSAVTQTAQGRAQATGAQMMAHRAAAERLGATLRQTGATAAKGAAGIGALTLATTGLGDKMGLTNTVVLGLAGSMMGPWGAAAGAGVGAAIDLSRANDELKDSFKAVDLALGAGNLDMAVKNLARVRKEISDLGRVDGLRDTIGDLPKLLSGIATGDFKFKFGMDGIELIAPKAKEAARGVKELQDQVAQQAAFDRALAAARVASKGYDLVGQGAREAGQTVDQFRQSVARLTAGLTRQDAIDSYRSSLLDMTDAIKANGRSLNGSTRAGLANRAALRSIAGSAMEAAGQMRNFDRRTIFLDRARRDFMRAAMAAGATRAEARRLANQFGLLDRAHARPRVTANTSAAMREIMAVRTSLRNLDGDEATTFVNVVQRRRAGSHKDFAADGATVPKTGQPYADRHLYLLADGEEVISNRFGQADRHRELLKAINGNRLADGGTADILRRYASSGSAVRPDVAGAAGLDVNELARVLARNSRGISITTQQAVDTDDLIRRLNFAGAF